MNMTLTPSAEKFISRMIRFSGGGAAAGFRLQVTAGGCSGLASEFTVEQAPRAGDGVFESNGVKLFLPAESRLLLEGVTIDFSDSPMNSGLSFINPNASSCACSSSGSAPGVSSVAISSVTRNKNPSTP
jgi:iron-sulfur cluster assembly accessory protein